MRHVKNGNVKDPDYKHQVNYTGAPQSRNNHRQKDGREAEDDINAPHDDGADPSLQISCRHPQESASRK